jgi:hypothetical protein
MTRSFSFVRSVIVGLAAVGAIACGSADPLDGVGAAGADESAAASDPSLLVDDPGTLQDLETRGLGFASVLGTTGTTAEGLLASPAYARIAATVDHDLRTVHATDPASGIGVEFGHRLFDASWLRSPQARFELVAVVNRLDRKHVGGCGELRLVYRLAYTSSRSASRLPMTVNVVYPQPDDHAGCSSVAQRWLDAKSGTADALLAGPLATLSPIKQIEINFQASRWPSNLRPDMGGQSEYILRVFRPTADAVEQVPLENTPRTDLAPADRDELRGWIRDHLAEIDDGTAIVPDKFLATQATSVAPRGLARTANRAYTQLFADGASAFGDLDFSQTTQIKSASALMRRLDTMTCHGCHQARSIAGFHLLGEERDSAARLNALAVGHSPHMAEELPWRASILHAVASAKPSPAPRPFAERATSRGAYGSHCGLGDPSFASWTCGEGLACVDVHGDQVGMCLPADAAGGPVGDICETVVVTSDPNPAHDHVVSHRSLACDPKGQGSRCNGVDQGFPDGLCRTDCAAGDVGTIAGGTICGLIPSATGLSNCLAAHRPFEDCLSSSELNTPSFLQTCSATSPCRDDYACARVQNGPSATGACMPPYFAFEVRVDGHLFDQ